MTTVEAVDVQADAGFRIAMLNWIHESKTNPRRHFDAAALQDLANSIREKGVLVPLLVRPRGGHGAYELVAGARRYRAARAAGLESVPVIVRELDDKEALEIQVIENLQRADVHPLEEAEGYEQLLKKHGYDVETLAAKIGKSVSYLYQRLKLAALIEPAKKAFLESELTAGHAILVARLQPKDQKRSLDAFFEKQWIRGSYVRGSMSVRALDAWIHANVLLDLNAAPWDKGDATLANVGACHSCPKRTGFAATLFPDIAKKDTCTDPTCFEKKTHAFLERRKAELRDDGVKQPVAILGDGAHRSEDYKNAISKYDYKRVGAEACKYVERGIVIAGDGIGQTPNICRSTECKEHRGYVSIGPSSASKAAAQRSDAARKLKTAVYTECLWTAVELLPTRPGEPEFRLLIQALVDEMHHDALKRYCDIAKIERSGAQSYGEAVLKTVAKAKAPELFRVLFGLALVPDTIVYPYYGGTASKPERLVAAAKVYGFTIDAVEKKIRAKKDDKDTMAGFLSVACPRCRAKPGSPCKRPSEHNTFGGEPHKQRVEAAETLNQKATKKGAR